MGDLVEEKVVLDVHYTDDTKELYEAFILKLENEGWVQEHVSVDCRHGRGGYYYRSMVRRVVRE